MAFGPESDRRTMRLFASVRERLRRDPRRIVIVGARGWIGRTTLELLREALEPGDFAARVACFGSSDGTIALDGGTTVPQRAVAHLAELDARPTLLLHLAFLTKDKVADMAEDAYVAANRTLSQGVLTALDAIGVDRLFVASSGAAAFVDDDHAAPDLRLYGRLKREDEDRFAAWAEAAPGRRAAIGRIYSVSGPYINKHETYALASFLLDALAGRPIEVRAPMPVLRSYVPVRELVSFVLGTLLADEGPAALRFDTGGAALELADVAGAAARLFGTSVQRRPITDPRENRYVGDETAWSALLAGIGMTSLPLSEQLAETAAWLARTAGRTG